MDPFVKATFQGKTQETHPHYGSGKFPNWNEKLEYDVRSGAHQDFSV
jgi:hypothetical protein